MGKSIRKRVAKFELEPDGFSIHTFELSCQIKNTRYREIKDYLYSLHTEDGGIVTYKEGNFIKCKAFSDYGINITLEKHSSKDGQYRGMYIRVFVSPRRLLDPNTSYLGILTPTRKSIDEVAEQFSALFEDTPIPNKIDKYILTRADLCTNIRCSSKKLFREMVRVIHKLPTPPKYKREQHKTDTKGMSKAKKSAAVKADNKYNKHYFKVSCGGGALVIYDKTYQMSAEGLTEVAYEDYGCGVLRFECRLERDKLRKVIDQEKIKKTKQLLKHLINNSEDMMIDAFSRCFAEDDFCRLKEIERTIRASRYHNATKDIMLELSSRLSRGKIVDNVFERMEKDGRKFDRKDILDRFEELGISPIPLWKNFCAERLPSPITLLRGISDGKIKVDYVLIK